MIDMGEIEAYLRDMPRARWQIVDAGGREARTPRSVEARGQKERDENGHPVGTRVSLSFRVTGALVSGTSSSTVSGVLFGGSSSDLVQTATIYLPVTEVGAYVSDQIVEDIKFITQLEQPRVPPAVR
jgi:hypothetical protein